MRSGKNIACQKPKFLKTGKRPAISEFYNGLQWKETGKDKLSRLFEKLQRMCKKSKYDPICPCPKAKTKRQNITKYCQKFYKWYSFGFPQVVENSVETVENGRVKGWFFHNWQDVLCKGAQLFVETPVESVESLPGKFYCQKVHITGQRP
ncbi:MAG: hypothetical protein MSH10_08680 [Pygmaiobacter massiliensis]|nr:hypothetical protein [Pygmaiobacter massiliensis]